MKQHPENPIRLVDLPRGQDPNQVALLIRSATAAPDDDTPAVKWRIRNTLHQRRQRSGRVLRFALTATIIFLAGGVAGAVVSPLVRMRLLGLFLLQREPSSVAPAGHGGRREARQPVSPAVQTSTESAPLPLENAATNAPATPPSATPKAPAAPRRVAVLTPSSSRPPASAELQPALPAQPLAPPAVPAPEIPTPGASAGPEPAAPSDEHQLITTALHKLRTSHEPEAALDTLDDYRRRFPSGQLAPEAARLRAEALLLLGRKATLREELDRSLPSETPASDERVVLRGELRAATGRWSAALTDFDAVVRAHTKVTCGGAETTDRRARDGLERALWGRAAALSHVGDDAGARADLREYLRRFPDGRFAAQAHRLLNERR